ncbi:MAG: [protein-PII] uridylyltransferase [Actinomycetota bacterium]|nr:[protein-PII] uridylyltransferase [Actinomycetota bacterium]
MTSTGSAADLAAARAAVLDDPDLRGLDLCRVLSDRTDAWLARLLAEAAASADGGAPTGVALVAVGGYGRRELSGQSDLDLILLHEPGHIGGAELEELATKVWYPIWDQGVKLGHAVRTVDGALDLARDDVETATSLLDVRLVAGDAALAAALADAAAKQWTKRARKVLPELRRAMLERHRTKGELAFLLEPDLKASRGGLRDVHTLRWMDLAEPVLDESDRAVLDESYLVVLEARVALHRSTGRPSDVLLLQEQDVVGGELGVDADELMRRVATAARSVGWVLDDAFDRSTRSRRRFRSRPQTVDEGTVVRDERVLVVEMPSDDERALVRVLRAAAEAAQRGLRLDRSTLEMLSARYPAGPDPWPPQLREAFCDLLAAGHPMIPVMEQLDHWDLLARILPEWAHVRSRPQRNAYHRFTVDRHLCETAANAAALTADVERPDLLLVGALLHDIGKGLPGDHTDVGIELVERIGPRMGYDADDTAVLVDMVRHHLLLPDVATRRDIADDLTIRSVADAVGDQRRLELLAALTEADSLATGPAAWGDWKASLVRTLAERVRHVLDGAAPAEVVSHDFPDDRHRELLAAGQRSISGDGEVLTVVTADRPGVFSRVAGVLALNGLEVVGALAHSADGMALCEFRVETTFGGEVAWRGVEEQLGRALDGRLAVRARVAERAHTYARSGPRSPSIVDREIVVDNAASEVATVFEVRAPDGVGLLYRVTSALAELDLDIRSAKVQTLGEDVVDSFYVCGPDGGKVTDPAHVEEVRRALNQAIDDSDG